MKTYTYALLAAAAATGMALGQTAYTTPVGYVALGDTAPGQSAVKAKTDVLLTAPLDRPSVYTGLIASVSGGNQITLQGTPNFTGGQFTSSPFIVKIASGAKAGFYALVNANTANSLTVTLPAGQNLTGVANGDKISVRPAWTAKSFFAGNSIPADTELYQYSGTVAGINLAADLLFVWDGTDWLDGVSGEVADPIIYPGELFILRNNSTSPIATLSVAGEVPASSFTNVVTNYGAGRQDLPFGVFSAVDQTLSESGLTSIAAADDEIFIYTNSSSGINKAASTGFVFDGSDWLDSTSGEPVPSTYKLKSGDGFVYRRIANGATTNWTATPSYIPSL